MLIDGIVSSKHPFYSVWKNMNRRCHTPSNPFYKDYGARGISVCDRWRSFSNFVADMGVRPDGFTIERIDNSKGYSPENCKWADRSSQQLNRRVDSRNKTGHSGVSFRGGYWLAEISWKKEKFLIGLYRDKDQAVAARKVFEADLLSGKNPLSSKQRARPYNKIGERHISFYRNKVYIVQFWIEGKYFQVGRFNNLEEAKHARDRFIATRTPRLETGARQAENRS